MDCTIKRIDPQTEPQLMELEIAVFSGEQNISEEEIKEVSHGTWWGTYHEAKLVGAVCAWKDGDGLYHWGRFCVAEKCRGQGIAKRLARESLTDLFAQGVDQIYSEARDATVRILQGFGAEIVGEPTEFCGSNITPMLLTKEAFVP